MTVQAGTPLVGHSEQLVRDLAVAFRARKLGPAIRWQFGTVDRRVIELTRAATSEPEAHAFTTVAAAFALWHSGRADVHSGAATTNLGRAMRQLGRGGTYGPKDPGAVRGLDRLMSANTYPEVHAGVVHALTQLRGSTHAPNWVGLATDLVDWQTGPAGRDRVRSGWGRGFYTYVPKNEDEPAQPK